MAAADQLPFFTFIVAFYLEFCVLFMLYRFWGLVLLYRFLVGRTTICITNRVHC